MKLINDFFNKLTQDIDKKYFPDVKYYRDNQYCIDVHYTIELFNNGVLTYKKLIERLSKSCKETKENIHNIVKQYVADFEGCEYK